MLTIPQVACFTSRANEKALIKILTEDLLMGAAPDVLVQEPPDPSNPLLSMDNVWITPHVDGLTMDT